MPIADRSRSSASPSLTPRVVVVSRYDYSEEAALGYTLVTYLTELPLRVAYVSSRSLPLQLPEVHPRYDRRVYRSTLPSQRNVVWKDVSSVIWLDPAAYPVLHTVGVNRSKFSHPRRNIFLRQFKTPDDFSLLPGDDSCREKIGESIETYTERLLKAGAVPETSQDTLVDCPWDTDIPLIATVPDRSEPPRLVVLAGLSADDKAALALPRIAQHIQALLKYHTSLRVDVLCAANLFGSAEGVAPPWWAKLKDIFPTRCFLHTRPLPRRDRVRLLKQADFALDLSFSSFGYWSTEAASCGCLVLRPSDTTVPFLAEDLRAALVELPPCSRWLAETGDSIEANQVLQQMSNLISRLSYFRSNRGRPGLEARRIRFQAFWKAVLGVRL